MQRDAATVVDIQHAARLIVQFSEGLEFDDFVADLKTQSAILHQLLIVGEATKRLSPQFRSQHPAIPWDKVAGMRDKLIHHYDRMELKTVWETIMRDVPALLNYLTTLTP